MAISVTAEIVACEVRSSQDYFATHGRGQWEAKAQALGTGRTALSVEMGWRRLEKRAREAETAPARSSALALVPIPPSPKDVRPETPQCMLPPVKVEEPPAQLGQAPCRAGRPGRRPCC